MNEAKEKLIALIRAEDIRQYSYKQLAEKIGLKHGSQSRHYLMSLMDDEIIAKAGNGSYVVTKGPQSNSVLTFPLMGRANCGIATEYADNTVQGVVRVSPSEVNIKNPAKVFALEAVGESMNQAKIQNKNIETGDYVFVEPKTWWDISDGDYVVSVIDGMANIKRLRIDSLHARLVLASESSEDHAPIIISSEDLHLYHLVGNVVDVVKKVDV